MNARLALTRPLFLAFFLGCAISLSTARILTVRLIVPGMIYWSFVPLVEIAALAIVCRRRREIPFSKLIDSFFQGYSPWLLWLVGMSGIWCLLSPSLKTLDWTISVVWFLAGIAVAVAWSIRIDLHFFRSVLGRTGESAMRALMLHRVISWTLILGIIAGPTIWSGITGELW
jgi:hypothetical protein